MCITSSASFCNQVKMSDTIKKSTTMEKLRSVDNSPRVSLQDIDTVFIKLFLKWVFYLKSTTNPNCQNPVEMYGNNYHYWQPWQNMSSWFSTRQINISLSYQHICKNQIIWRMFQCIGQHRYLFSAFALIMEAILTSDVVPLSECLLLNKEISRTLSSFFLPGYKKFTEALSLNILTDHHSPKAWIHSYCWNLTKSRSLL